MTAERDQEAQFAAMMRYLEERAPRQFGSTQEIDIAQVEQRLHAQLGRSGLRGQAHASAPGPGTPSSIGDTPDQSRHPLLMGSGSIRRRRRRVPSTSVGRSPPSIRQEYPSSTGPRTGELQGRGSTPDQSSLRATLLDRQGAGGLRYSDRLVSDYTRQMELIFGARPSTPDTSRGETSTESTLPEDMWSTGSRNEGGQE